MSNDLSVKKTRIRALDPEEFEDYHCFVILPRRGSTMSNSLQQHGIPEVQRQLRLQMKRHHLDTIKVEVTRRAGKLKFNFTGSPEEVIKADEILASWP